MNHRLNDRTQSALTDNTTFATADFENASRGDLNCKFKGEDVFYIALRFCFDADSFENLINECSITVLVRRFFIYFFSTVNLD